jgi:hypothetical protein
MNAGVLIFFVCMIVICFSVMLMFAGAGGSGTASTKTSSGPAPAPNDGNVLTITENGTAKTNTSTEGYRMRRERYLIMPKVQMCHQTDNVPGWCSSIEYNKEKNGIPFFYDLEYEADNQSFDRVCEGEMCSETVACKDGGFDCVFTEKFNDEGTLYSISNKAGEELLDMMADDAWSGKWDNWGFIDRLKREVKYSDGKLYARTGEDTEVELTLKMALEEGGNASVYFIALLAFMHENGEPKPDRIVLAVKGAKDAFQTRVTRQNTTVQAKQADEGQ